MATVLNGYPTKNKESSPQDVTTTSYSTPNKIAIDVSIKNDNNDPIPVVQIPTGPTLLSVTPANQKNTLTWSAVAGATDYVIYRSTTSGVTTEDTEIDTGSTSTTYEDTGLTNGTEYFYRVLAIGAWGYTGLGNEASATPISYTNAYSLLFDGINEYVTFGNNHNYEHNVPFTLSLWVKVTNMAGSRKSLWTKTTNDANVYGWGFYIKTSGEIFIQARTASTLRQHTTSTVGLTAGNWYHIVFTYSGASNMNGFRIYVDGGVRTTPSSATLGGTIVNTDDSFLAIRNSSFPLNGNLDEVSFWGVALSASEVTELYNSGTPDDLTNHSQYANLQHWYKMGDSDTFPTAADSEGAVNGTMTNMESGDIVVDTP